jgi:hypothetical protein
MDGIQVLGANNMNRTYQFVLVVYRMEGVGVYGERVTSCTESMAVGAVSFLSPRERLHCEHDGETS